MKERTETEILHRVAAYCSAAERCIWDVAQKIRAAGLNREAEEKIIARLLQEKFIDESRFCRSFVNDKLRFNKWGKIKIGYELRKKHIQETHITEALAAIKEDAYLSTLSTLLKEKKKTIRGKDQRETYYKLLRFAAGRGFENKDINQCLKQLNIDGDEEEYRE
ncbi:RecX family transcriptional regulator [Parabacteroides sp. 52]|uniref:regulatory protein RecX n=1 Tax=unclassified Parabacteroides TaxID=2649774 RepID=UPI0013D5C00B|nr:MULTISPECIES: regulatory protein RecX [unclassified Parabacteroides]MDH6534130.1 regulatory protein [Parabacteroides sp. PM5-20]NDV54967.1 RecX family transcriptional regulator [Parabacteroides sp. 52]